MVRTLKIFGFIVFFILSFALFMPKLNLYYMLEGELQKQNIIISDEKIKETAFKLTITDANISFDTLESARFKELDLIMFLLYQSLKIQDIRLLGVASSFMPTKIDHVNISYAVTNPLIVNISANGAFGTTKGIFNIREKKLHLTLTASKQMQQKYKKTLSYLTKTKDGGYIYDTIFN